MERLRRLLSYSVGSSESTVNGSMKYKPNQLQAAGMILTQVPEEPWATGCADFVGPLPWELDAVGPGGQATTETPRKDVRERIVAIYGVPKVMVTDNGVQFKRRAFRRFLEELGVRNGSRLHIPERANGTVKIINNSPAFITQGRDPRLPNALFDEQTTGTGRCAEKLKRRRIRRATIIFEDGRGNPSWGSVVARRRSWRRGLTAVPNKKIRHQRLSAF